MKLLFHTIALEPARWTPQRSSFRLIDLLGPIAESGFNRLEIYEPHLDGPADEIRDRLALHQLQPVILSSYLNLNPAVTSDDKLSEMTEAVVERIHFFGFKSLRIFPGSKMTQTNEADLHQFIERLRHLAEQLPQTGILLETHDGTLADDPQFLVRIVEELALPNVGLLYQPLVFTAEKALEQWALQRHLIRHIHLQNRSPDLSFATIQDGVVPWKSLLADLPPGVDATLEFVPAGICSVDQFNLDVTLAQARFEFEYIRQIAKMELAALDANLSLANVDNTDA